MSEKNEVYFRISPNIYKYKSLLTIIEVLEHVFENKRQLHPRSVLNNNHMSLMKNIANTVF